MYTIVYVLHDTKIMRNVCFTLLTLILIACGGPEVGYVLPEFQPHLDSFNEEAIERGYRFNTDNITVIFEERKRLVIADCEHSSKTIRVDPTAWKAMSPKFKEVLMFHELGHCVLDMGHSTGIMTSNISWVYRDFSGKKREKYLDDFFGGIK